jgi:hypothetical protein
MIIYLDTNVLQALKKEENKDLYDKILSDKFKNIYCFSEAHLYDLDRDKTENKFSDMTFYESIVEKSCLIWEDDAINFSIETPHNYYDRFDWDTSMDFSLFEDPSLVDLKNVMENIPAFPNLNSDSLDISAMPNGVSNLLTGNKSFLDFTNNLLGWTESLADNKTNDYKSLLQYLHSAKNSLQLRGIKDGYITDRKEFKKSFFDYFRFKNLDNSTYSLFIEMYNGLEILGIIKGIPKKQKFVNLLNDARHAFFGAWCDLVVSSDKDFLNKSNFIYTLRDCGTSLMTIEEFSNFIFSKKTGTFNDMLLEEIEFFNCNPYQIDVEKEGEFTFTTKHTKRISYNYFNTLTSVENDDTRSFYFSKRLNTLFQSILYKEISVITQFLLDDLGMDLENKGSFVREEIAEKIWGGRKWRNGQLFIQLNFKKKLYIMIQVIPEQPEKIIRQK